MNMWNKIKVGDVIHSKEEEGNSTIINYGIITQRSKDSICVYYFDGETIVYRDKWGIRTVNREFKILKEASL